MTIRDIAKKTGFAVSTVSRALNDHPDISAETKEKIRKIVKQYNFVPNSNARQLKAQTNNAICIIVAGASNMFLESILQRVQTQIATEGYATEVHYVDEHSNVVEVAVQLQREYKPLGMFFLGGNVQDFKKGFQQIHLPCVLTASAAKELQFENLSMVSIDDQAAGGDACRYLIQKGHHKIAVIGGERKTSYISAERWQGFCLEYQKLLDCPCLEEWYFTAGFRFESGYHTMKQILQKKSLPTVVFCLSDIIAVGAMRAIYEAGLQVPKDISVLGFDGIPLVRYCTPSLSSVKQPQDILADTSVQLLLQQLKTGIPGQMITAPVELLQGESVCNIATTESNLG